MPLQPSSTEAGNVLAPRAVPADAGLRRRYARYRRAEAHRLLELVPRPALRDLWRSALAWDAERHPERGESTVAPSTELLVSFCEERLPLPPFDVWRDDFLAHRAEHLATEAATVGPVERTAEPFSVERRFFDAPDGSTWTAVLDVRAEGAGRWHGRISFHPVGEGELTPRTHRTGEILRAPTAESARESFRAFDDHTLRAFLRSTLP